MNSILFFLLWGKGGADSDKELALYRQEQDDEWTHVFYTTKNPSSSGQIP